MTTTRISFDYHGSPISLNLFEDDHITRTISASSGFYEQLMLEDMMRRTNPGDLVIDVGAYVGTHTVFLAAIADLEVIAVEPAGYSAALLKENVEQNRLSGRVTVREVGAGSQSGTATIVRGPQSNLGMSSLALGPGLVKIETIDHIANDRKVALLKIDVEGMEHDVLLGASQTLADSRPLVYVEVAHPESERSVAAQLAKAGYRFAREFNRTPSQLWVPFDHFAPGVYPEWLVTQAADQAYSLRDTMRMVEALRDAQLEHAREVREHRSRLEKTTNLLAELYKRTQAATRSSQEVLQLLEDLRDRLLALEPQQQDVAGSEEE